MMLKAKNDLSRVLRQIKTIHKAVAYVVGGSDEMSLPLLLTSKGPAVVIDAHIDVKSKAAMQLDDVPITYHETSRSHLRDFIQSEHVPLTFFGLQGHLITRQDVEICKGATLVYINRDIRRPNLQVSRVLNLDSVDSVSLDLSALKTSHCCGVTYPSPSEGFEIDEAHELAFKIGNSQVTQVGVSEYNPAIEKFKTGTLMVQLLTQFLHGLN